MKFYCSILILILLGGIPGCLFSRDTSNLDHPFENSEIPIIAPLPALTSEIEGQLKKNPLLEILFKLAWNRNPDIKAARLRWRAAIERIPQVASYPDPVITYTYYSKEVETRVGPQKQAITAQQKIPFPGKLSLKGNIAEREVNIARLQTERTIRNVLVALKLSYYELYYLDQAQLLYVQQEKLLKKYVAFAAGESATGRVKLSETFRAQSLLAQIAYDLILLKEMRETQG